MRKKYLLLVFCLIILSCHKKEVKTVIQTPNESAEIFDFPEFIPTHILLKDDVYEEPDLSAKTFMFLIYSGEFIQILEYGNNVSINGENKQWVKIWNGKNKHAKYCLSDNIKELIQPIEYRPMNNIDIKSVVLPNADGTINNFTIEGKFGGDSYDYGINTIYLEYYARNEEYDDEFQHDNMYYPEDYRLMELCVQNDVNCFPSVYFTTHHRKNIKNNITFVDSFMFSAHESADITTWRWIFLSTNNYDINITIIPSDKNLKKEIVSEAPKYFREYTDDGFVDYIDQDPSSGKVHWADVEKIDALNAFGDDLINGVNPSKTLKKWYNETEDILNKLQLK